MNTIYIVPIEPIDARYTKQWYENIPKILEKSISENKLDKRVVTIDGASIPAGTTTGAFLDFGATNVYKASQTETISRMFSNGDIKPGDKFLVTDAWNFVITAIRYMSDLLDIPVEIHGIWHAGAYDPTDILGYKMQKPWPHYQERAWFYACDYNYYATNFHKEMFLRNLEIPKEFHHKAIRSGQPHNLIIDNLEKYKHTLKNDVVMWPHRYNSDKQPEIAEKLSEEFNFCITQKMNLNKSEFYETMGSSKIIFSCALHENLGISVMEGCLSGAIPIVPDRASYSEMYLPEFKYPTEWTINLESFEKNYNNLVEFIKNRIDNYEDFKELLSKQNQILKDNYLTSDIMVNKLLEINQ